MSFNKSYLGTKQPSYINQNNSELPMDSGIYIGVVKQIDTNTRSGRVWVYIPQFGGPDPDGQEDWRLVSYASPFMGKTLGAYGELGRPLSLADNTFAKSTQSYGFFMTPPDVGSEVLCCFIPGSNEGYWFACINSNLTRNMIPAIGCVPYSNIEEASVREAGLEPYLRVDYSYPAAEALDNLDAIYNSAGGNLNNIKKPIHIPQTVILIRQGLDGDPIRGAITSSSQRDPISSVFGFSTPGRPWGRQDPANDSNLNEKLTTGRFNPDDFKVTTRVGGHSLVMDDGDLYGKNNLVRLRSANGHQILMNDSEGLIYISNSSGTAWVELTKTGDVLIYSGKDLSIRTRGNLMMHSDNSISFFARQNINMVAGASVKLQGQVVQANADTALNFYGKQAQLKSQSVMGIISGGGMSIKASGPISINGSAIALNGGGGGGEVAPPQKIGVYNLDEAQYDGYNWFVQPNALRSTNYKVPTHEPYIRGNTRAVAENQVQLLNSLAFDIDGNPISPPVGITPRGPESALNQALTSQAPAGVFISQPIPQAGMGILNQDQLRAFMAQTGYSESSGDYAAQNQFGYQGKYQLGSAALQDLGYVKAGTPQTTEALNNPNNWTGKDGMVSSDAFKNNQTVQETAMYNYSRQNYATLERQGVISATTTADQAAGLLSAAHLVGAGGAATWYKTGGVVQDANGTSAASYYNRGIYSQTQVPVITASNASKPG
jgi:hypothetical protein